MTEWINIVGFFVILGFALMDTFRFETWGTLAFWMMVAVFTIFCYALLTLLVT